MVIREGQGDFLGQIGAMKAGSLAPLVPLDPLAPGCWFIDFIDVIRSTESRIPVLSKKWKRKEERARCHNSAYLSMTIPWYHSFWLRLICTDMYAYTYTYT